MDEFWLDRLPAGRKGTRWDQVLAVLVCYRLLSPGSEWRLRREWFLHTALAEEHRLYGCHDRLLEHKAEVFAHLRERWRDLFNASFDVLLYDLTSTYFESEPPLAEGDKRRFGYSRDKRSDCVQVVIALIVTPKGRLSQYEAALLQKSWQEVRPGVQVKLLPQDKELYVLAESVDRIAKERSMRRRQLKGLWQRLKALQAMELSRDQLLKKLGAAQHAAPSAWRLVELAVSATEATFSYQLRKDKLRQVRRREGRYLLRSNLTESDSAKLWTFYLQLTQVEEAFKTLKGDLALRPVFHQLESRIEAHIFIAFPAYCLHVTLGRRLRDLAPGLTSRSVLEKFAAVQMLDVRIPTTDGREVVLTRYTQPEKDLQLLLTKLKLELPAQPPPKITTHGHQLNSCSADL